MAGVIHYIATEIVAGSCMLNRVERKFSIDRILRVRVRSIASSGAHQNPSAALSHFGRWTSFDSGKGTDGDHRTVGCKKLYENRAAVYYSLPGKCWSKPYNQKNAWCAKQEPGGECPPGVIPDGVRCLWSTELLGHVSIDDLSGITSRGYRSHADFCDRDGREVRGNRICFWNDPPSEAAKQALVEERVSTLENLFLAKYPAQGRDIPAPECPWG